MNTRNYLKTFTLSTLILFAAVSFSYPQTAKISGPRQEKLLNNLKLLIWTEPVAEKVTVKLRIHSGAAFDLQNKEGTMALLADILFPNETSKEFFREDLGGSLHVVSNYDYIQINATGNPDQVLVILETLAGAVTKPVIDKETTAKARAARIEKVKELEKNPSHVADQAIAKRLFGTFPYGRSADGTAESLAKIDFADLLLAKQRFLTADNATLVVSGNVKSDFVFKAVRQLFGGWEKSDRKIPATFAQPDVPDTKEFSIETPNAENGLWRSAIMVAARNDKDFYATKVLTEIWQNQFCFNDESKYGKSSFEPHLLRGIYVVSKNVLLNEPPSPGRNPCSLMLMKDGKAVYPPITQSNFEQAKSKIIADLNQKTLSAIDSADLWLDVDTYRLVSVKDEMQKANNITLADVQRVAENLQKQPLVIVSVKKSSEAKQ